MVGLQVQLRSAGPIRLQAQFDCAAGELVALVGPSGSGKTSILRAIAGLWTAAQVQGQIRVAGQAWLDSAAGVAWKPQQRRAGLVFQHYALFPHMTAQANVALAAGPAWSHNDVQALLTRMGLGHLTQRRPAELSGGQQQRVALARAWVRVMPALAALPVRTGNAAAGVLLLDEPFSAVDAPTRQTLYRELAAWRLQVPVPMVLVTHDLAEARRLADKVVILDAGQTLQTGSPSRVFASPRNARVAQLVGIQNHFHGHFYKSQPGWARLRWTPKTDTGSALELTVVDKGKIPNGTPVTWVLNGEHVDVLADDHPSYPCESGATFLRCSVAEVLALGEMSLCTLQPVGLNGATITLNLNTRLLDRLAVSTGGAVVLRIEPLALHIMPVRESRS
jgi:molybdate transport system ATP-binding protein